MVALLLVLILFTGVVSICSSPPLIIGFNENKISYKLYFFIICLSTILILGCRGNFTSDYVNYTYLFDSISEMSFLEVLTNPNSVHASLLFRLIVRITQIITDDYQSIFFVLAVIEMIFVGVAAKRSCSVSWLMMFLFIATGLFSVGFNITRQMIAVAISLFAFEFLVKDENRKYLCCVAASYFIQESAVILIPFYLVSKLPWNRKRIRLAFMVSLVMMCIVYFFAQPIAMFGARFMQREYDASVYGISNGLPVTSLTLPIIIWLCVFLLRRQIDYKNKSDIVGLISVAAYSIFSIASLRIELMIRFSYFFLGIICMFIPNLLARKKTSRRIAILLCCVLFFSYFLMSSASKLDYVFFWG